MGQVMKGALALLVIAGLGSIGFSIWEMRQAEPLQLLPPAQRTEVDRESAARTAAVRSERLDGTECQKLDARSCDEVRRQRDLLAAARAWHDSDAKSARDEAGVQ
jgi:hypothetical protein